MFKNSSAFAAGIIFTVMVNLLGYQALKKYPYSFNDSNLFLICVVAIVCICSTVILVLAPIDQFGKADKLKAVVYYKIVGNVFIVLSLLLVISMRHLEMITQDLFLAGVIACLGALGVKLTVDSRKEKDYLSFVDPDTNKEKVEGNSPS